MATYAQLEQERWWRDEVVPPNLNLLARRLRDRYGVGPDAIGCKGDNRHLRGAHRSRNWIKNSVYCTNRTYTVSRTEGDRSGGDGDWVCGMDIVIPREDLIPMCARLDKAVRAGLLEKITEWYGNDDGDNRVDGYDNIANRVASSDESHLWHLHLTFDRGRANDDHADLYAILTGEEDDMAFGDDEAKQLEATNARVRALAQLRPKIKVTWDPEHPTGYEDVPAVVLLTEMAAKIDALATASGVDLAALKAVVDASIAEATPAIADAVGDEIAAGLTD